MLNLKEQIRSRGIWLLQVDRQLIDGSRSRARTLLRAFATHRFKVFLSLASVGPMALQGCTQSEDLSMPTPPVAEKRHHLTTHHGITIEDPYHWLKDQSYPKVDDEDVLGYLKAENAYSEHMLAPLQDEIETLFQEMKSRVDLRDESVPARQGSYFYQSRFDGEEQYRTHLRWPADEPEPDDDKKSVILDAAELAKEFEYFRLGAFSVSPDERLLAYATDTDGSERFTIVVKDLVSGEMLPDTISQTIGSIEWSSDSKGFFYQLVDENWRPDRVNYHVLGTDIASDRKVFHEQDPSFFVSIDSSLSQSYLFISPSTHVTSEVWFLPLDEPETDPILIEARTAQHEYDVDHVGDSFYILTNDTHKNFRLAKTPVDTPQRQNWETVVAGSNDRYLVDHFCISEGVVLSLRHRGVSKIEILRYDGEVVDVPFDEPIYHAYTTDNREFMADRLRLGFTSLVTPETTFDFDLGTRTLEALKVRDVPGGYDPSEYVSIRHWVTARDQTQVPVSVVHRRGIELAEAPMYLYGYGAYGYAMEPRFSTSRLSLLDRGFIYAIAHIRGGNELGYHWYEDGKLDKRKNTFNDFVDVAHGLLDMGYSKGGSIAIAGGSAGGELMGAVINQAPDLWGVAVLHVPFVDVLNTMLDESLPLTPMEWPEWGNPITDKEAFVYIRSYSPYDQLRPVEYPPMLVTAGLNDPRVTYWEPAKYVAKVRSLNQGDSAVLLRTEMGAGHGGRSGRFDSLREVAEEFAFINHALELDGKEIETLHASRKGASSVGS